MVKYKKRHELRRRVQYWYNKTLGRPNYITNIRPRGYRKALDLRGIPLTECVCEGNAWCVKVSWSFEGDMELIFAEMECVHCGSIANIPTWTTMEEWGLMDNA